MLWILHRSGPSVSLNWVTRVQGWGQRGAHRAGQTHIHTHLNHRGLKMGSLNVGAPRERKMWVSSQDWVGDGIKWLFTETLEHFLFCKHCHITEYANSRDGMASYFAVNLLFVLLWALHKLSRSLTLGVCACKSSVTHTVVAELL